MPSPPLDTKNGSTTENTVKLEAPEQVSALENDAPILLLPPKRFAVNDLHPVQEADLNQLENASSKAQMRFSCATFFFGASIGLSGNLLALPDGWRNHPILALSISVLTALGGYCLLEYRYARKERDETLLRMKKRTY